MIPQFYFYNINLPKVDKIIVAPSGILHVLFEGVIHVQQGQVVTINVGEAELAVVRGFLCL